jgi:hypothetical protein
MGTKSTLCFLQALTVCFVITLFQFVVLLLDVFGILQCRFFTALCFSQASCKLIYTLFNFA